MKVSQYPYSRVDMEALKARCAELAREVEAATDWKQLLDVRDKMIAEEKHVMTTMTTAELRFCLNTADTFYLEEKEFYDERSPEIGVAMLAFNKAFLASPHLEEAVKHGLNPLVIKQYECNVRSADPRIVEDSAEENKLVTRYVKIMSDLVVDFRGEKLPFTLLKKYFLDKDRDTRRDAYSAFGAALEAVSGEIDDIFDKLVHLRNKMARTLGYQNFIPLAYDRLGRIGFTRAEADVFAENVLNEYVPLLDRMKREVGKSLGIEKLKLYDNESYFADGNPTPVGTPEEMFAAAKDMYHTMDADAGAFFDYMLDADAFDVLSRKGKWGGGFCTSFPDYAQPFILANFNGSSADVDVLTHEAGHAFADYMLYKQGNDFELNVGGMETAETHSMSMEFFCWKYIDRFFGARAQDYKFMHLGDALTFIPYGTMVDRFQHIMYEQEDLTPAARKDVWLELERKYRPYMDADGIPYLEKGTRWQYQMHIFENPFYYIDYCFAQTAALQFLLASRTDYADAFARYKTLLKTGGGKTFAELMKTAGLKPSFEKGVLRTVGEKALALHKSLQEK